MCGIAGAIGAIDAEVRDAVERMTRAQAHRGPDQSGIWSSAPAGARGAVFGHRRLSILDLTEAGRQPMRDSKTGAVIVFNGEVYNFAALREELGDEDFHSSTDTEVVLKAYLRMGDDVFSRLRGMFALAIFDPNRECVVVARDRLGIKPLYLSDTDGKRVLFASELRALLASGLVDRKLDPAGVERFLWHGFVPGPGTIISGVRLLPAGSTMTVGLGGRVGPPRRYWQVPRAVPIEPERAVRELGDALSDAVRLHLISDVPLGIFLSGGVDSSAVAALAQRNSTRPVTTFTIRFDEPEFDESLYAQDIARRLGTVHHEIPLTEVSFDSQLDAALSALDQPTFDAINTYFVSRAVKEAGITVALAGTGGDELFGGYASFSDLPRARRVAKQLTLLPERARSRLARIATRIAMGQPSEVPPQTRWGKLSDVFATEGDLVSLYQVSYALFSREIHSELTLKRAKDIHWGLEATRLQELRASIKSEPELSAISRLELASFLGERLLRDTDTASMAVALEVRVPLLDHKVIEALAQVPEHVRYHPLRRKNLLRQLIHEQIATHAFDRPKAGFVLPLETWCRRRLGPRLEAIFHDVGLAHQIGINGETVARIWRSFSKGTSPLYWSRVWSIFVLMSWCQTHGVYL